MSDPAAGDSAPAAAPKPAPVLLTKRVAVAPRGTKNYVDLTLETLHSRAYPLYDQVYFYFRREAGKPIDPKVREFLRYILSREGQDEVQKDAKYIPLPADVVREQLTKLQ